MKKLFVAFAVVSLLAACNSEEKKADQDSKDVAMDKNEKKFDTTDLKDDTKFVVEAADGGMLEVKLGELAQTNGAAPDVKMLGKMMVTDHGKANEELKTVAQKYNISIAAGLSDKYQKEYNELAAKKGKDFDKAYTDLMVDDHENDIKAFQDEADKGKIAELKTWASGKLPVLQHHLEMSKQAKDAVKGK